MENAASAQTGLSLLVDWGNEQDHWVRALASEVIKSRKALGDEQAKTFYDLLLREKELKDGDPPSVPLLQEKL